MKCHGNQKGYAWAVQLACNTELCVMAALMKLQMDVGLELREVHVPAIESKCQFKFHRGCLLAFIPAETYTAEQRKQRATGGKELVSYQVWNELNSW